MYWNHMGDTADITLEEKTVSHSLLVIQPIMLNDRVTNS